ncbi:MAG: hypothetical protein AAF492_05010, partial [Verrucomicrobiota bacterium]
DVANPKAPLHFVLRSIDVDHEAWSAFAQTRSINQQKQDAWSWVRKRARDGTAEITASWSMSADHGRQTLLQQGHEMIYPSEYAPHRSSSGAAQKHPVSAPLIPTALETRNAGTSLQIEGTRSPEGYVQVWYDFKHVRLAGQSVHHRIKEGEEWIPDATMPTFATMNQSSTAIVCPGRTSLIGVLAPLTPDGSPDESKRTLLFIEVK